MISQNHPREDFGKVREWLITKGEKLRVGQIWAPYAVFTFKTKRMDAKCLFVLMPDMVELILEQ